MLPTPRATDGTKGGPGQRGSKGDLMLPSAVAQIERNEPCSSGYAGAFDAPSSTSTSGREAGPRAATAGDSSSSLPLLPTPAASVANDGEGPETWLARRERVKETADNGNGMGMPLTIAVQLLPTPSVADTQGGRKHRSGDRNGELLLNGLAHHEQFGQYAPAIARQEQAFGHPAPSPTEPGKNGRPRLSAEFASWMMGAPPGWITDTPGVTRNEALRMAGNGVVRQQALAALLDMQRAMTKEDR